MSNALDIAKAGRGVLATGDWGRMYELGKRYADIGAKTEIVRVIDLIGKDHQHIPDPSANAARIVREATTDTKATAAELEATWAEWSSHIPKVDEQAMTLLRAAFEAGWDAGRNS